ncbi:MAG: serine/threonine-protein phosphatase [Anaerolineae bacterium]|nr:serine/threonine-protein phosphatase [Anaerolineae bacterium]
METPNAHAQQAPRPAPRTSLPLEVWGALDKGRAREGNEDAVYPHSGAETFPFQPSPERLAHKGQLLVVADGVGGAQAGSEASRWAIRVAVERYYDTVGPDLGADLRAAVEAANASLYQYLQSTGVREAGSTMVAAVVKGDLLHVANVGDSRAYLVRNHAITQLTRDHTLTQQKLDQHIIQPEQVALDPDRSVLTRSLGAGPDVKVDLFPPLKLAAGDVVLLCSDGLTDMVDEAEIVRTVQDEPPKRAAQRLIAAANRRGGFDNISVIVAHVGGRPAAAGGIPAALSGMRGWQRAVLGVLAAALLLLLCVAVGTGGWYVYTTTRGTPTAAPPPTATSVQTGPTVIPLVTDTPRPAGETPTPRATSTVAPSPTPTPTRTPLPDRDRDGVPDGVDRCPDESGPRDLQGCPDGDADGFVDIDDLCPALPGPLQGCPDSDGDTLPDHLDDCPMEWGPVEHDGCPVDTGGGGDDGGVPPTQPPPRN